MKTFTCHFVFGSYKDCYFKLGQYENGNTAIEIITAEDGYSEPLCKATVNIGKQFEQIIPIKNYSENAGLLNCLINAGFISRVISYEQQDFVKIPLCLMNWDKIKEYSL